MLEGCSRVPVHMPARDAMPEAHRAAKPRLPPVRPRRSARKMPAQQASMAAARLVAMDSLVAAACMPARDDVKPRFSLYVLVQTVARTPGQSKSVHTLSCSFHLFQGLYALRKRGVLQPITFFPRKDAVQEKGAAIPGSLVIAAAGRSGTFSAGQKLITAR